MRVVRYNLVMRKLILFTSTLLLFAAACDDSTTDATEFSTVRGVVVSDQAVNYDADSELIVRLLDVSLQDIPALIISEQVISGPEELPVPFLLPYDPEQIVEGHTYSVGARIERGTTLLYISDTSNPVITRGNPNRTTVDVVQVN